MVYEISEEKKLILTQMEEFAKKKIEPIAKNIDIEDHIPNEFYKEMQEYGLLTLTIPESYGGLGLDMFTYSKILEIVGRYSGGLALS